MEVKQNDRSHELYEESRRYLPGGVSSPVRAYKAVGGEPFFVSHARGSRIYDVDGNEYVDYACSYGPLIAGHAHPSVVEALKRAVEHGTSYGAPTELELVLAHLIIDAMPAVQKVRFVNSGTEATMSALRLARAYTGRDKIVKFEGCYHGHSDMLLIKAGSGVATLGLPDSPGVPPSITSETLSAPFNDLEATNELFKRYADEIAAVILEPVAGNMGVVPPRPGYLAGLREVTRAHGALLIFDEVITGFRVAYGGAQALYDLEPDLVCLGKIIGGGLPVGAYGGRAQIMELVAPSGPVYQAGTLSGNPLAMTAGIETLRLLQGEGVYHRLEERAKGLAEGLRGAAERAGVPVVIHRVGSMLTPFFTDREVADYDSATGCDTERYARYFHAMLERGIALPPSQFESWFVSLAHDEGDIERTIEAAGEAFVEARSS